MKREERRTHLLSCASRVFGEKGYHAASVSHIIKAAGVARGTFYLYFEGKRAVFDELVDDLLGLITRTVLHIDISGGTGSVVAQMEANVNGILDCLLKNRPMLRVLMTGGLGVDADFDKKIAEFYSGLTDLTETSLAQGMELKLIRPVDARVVSLCIIGSIKEVLFQIAMGRLLPSQEILVKEILDYNIGGLFVPEVARKLS